MCPLLVLVAIPSLTLLLTDTLGNFLAGDLLLRALLMALRVPSREQLSSRISGPPSSDATDAWPMCAMVWSYDNAVGGVCVVRGRVRTMLFGASHAVAAMEGGARAKIVSLAPAGAGPRTDGRAVPNF